jgi:transcriptional regulator GlxA family with amidase domain
MLNQNLDASNASGRVGYESALQFSREYSRLFGAPPQRDVRRTRLGQSSVPLGDVRETNPFGVV